MPRNSAALKLVEGEAEETMASLMAKLSKNFAAQAPIKAKLTPLEDEATALKKKLLPLLDSEGIRKSSTKTCTVSITEREGIVIDDLPKMLTALKRDGYEHCITLNVTKAKEYREKKGKEIPGTHTAVVTRFLTLSGIK